MMNEMRKVKIFGGSEVRYIGRGREKERGKVNERVKDGIRKELEVILRRSLFKGN